MKDRAKFILVLPLIALSVGAWLFIGSENEARVQFSRAVERWRVGEYHQAIQGFRTVQKRHPRSLLAPQALWEIGSIYYLNLYDIPQALHHFHTLIARYPESLLAVESHLKLAEIYELELNERDTALQHWENALSGRLEPARRAETLFQIADTHFKDGRFDEAFDRFSNLSSESVEENLVQRARVRLGAIFQIRKEYRESIKVFSQVLQSDACASCRVRAQLGLIESYELLDQLPRAIEIANQISSEDYPVDMKEALLERLLAKKQHYEPKLWVSP